MELNTADSAITIEFTELELRHMTRFGIHKLLARLPFRARRPFRQSKIKTEEIVECLCRPNVNEQYEQAVKAAFAEFEQAVMPATKVYNEELAAGLERYNAAILPAQEKLSKAIAEAKQKYLKE